MAPAGWASRQKVVPAQYRWVLEKLFLGLVVSEEPLNHFFENSKFSALCIFSIILFVCFLF